MSRYDLNNKVALVTGGARGIGFGTQRPDRARRLGGVVDLDQAAERAAAQLHDTRALGLAADVTDRGAMQRAVAATVERFGGLDVVVANAGIVSRSPRSGRSRRRTSSACSTSTWWASAGRSMPRCRRSSAARHVVLVSSIYAFMNGVGAVPYAMSKAAVEQLGRALRVELAPARRQRERRLLRIHRHRDDPSDRRQRPACPPMLARLPKPLHKRLSPTAAGEAIVCGIERRRPRIVRPRRWELVSALRGILGPLIDARMERDQKTQDHLRELEARTGDDRHMAV